MNAVGIIPARMGSTRFPGKVLADRTGWPLIRHVYENAKRAACLGRIAVATDDARVLAAVRVFGGEGVMTSPDHPNGTSRLNEAAAVMGLAADAVVVNVQGDEPELDPAVIDAAVRAMVESGAEIGTAATPIGTGAEAANPAVVKVVLALDGTAMYFSRSPIPHDRDGQGGEAARPLRHIGVYVYRRGFLARYVGMPPSPLERVEQLEQLRALQNGCRIAVAVMPAEEGPPKAGIDTPEQYDAFVERWRARSGRG